MNDALPKMKTDVIHTGINISEKRRREREKDEDSQMRITIESNWKGNIRKTAICKRQRKVQTSMITMVVDFHRDLAKEIQLAENENNSNVKKNVIRRQT